MKGERRTGRCLSICPLRIVHVVTADLGGKESEDFALHGTVLSCADPAEVTEDSILSFPKVKGFVSRQKLVTAVPC